MFKFIEQALSYCGILILGIFGVILGGIVLLVLLARIIELSSRKSSTFQVVSQFVRALKEFSLIVVIGLFLGTSVGAAIKSMLYITPAMLDGAIIGVLFSSIYALSLITPKWGHCYLDKHDYGPVDEHAHDDHYFVEGCKWCGKQPED